MILQATVERWTDAKTWQTWGLMDLEVKGGCVHDAALSGTLRSYLTLGCSPLGHYRVGKDSHFGVFVYEAKGDGENAARPITRGEFDAGEFA